MDLHDLGFHLHLVKTLHLLSIFVGNHSNNKLIRQFLWIGYVLYLTCKYDMDEVVFGKYFFFAYNIGNVFNALWIIIWVNEHIGTNPFQYITHSTNSIEFH